MRDLMAPLTALLVSASVLVTGQGLLGILVPLRAQLEGFSPVTLGVLGSAYYLGFVSGCFAGPLAIRRVGHIRTFAGFAAAVCAAVLVQSLVIDPYVWSALRIVTGHCLAGIYMVIESWLNERATNETRGTVLSIYAIITLTVIVVGQMLIVAVEPNSAEPFALVAIFVALAVIPVAMTTSIAPAPVAAITLDLRALYALSPVGVAGCLAAGLTSGAFWTLGPIFAQGNGLSAAGVAIFMSVGVLGGATFQWPLGRLSDLMDRRRVILAAAAFGCVAGLGLGFFGVGTLVYELPLVFFYGGASLTLYALSIAHANDLAEPSEFVSMGSGLLLVFALGAVLGPFLASTAMALVGGRGLFLFTAAILAMTAIFVIERITRRAPLAAGERAEFVQLPRSATPVAFAMDPRAEEEQETSAQAPSNPPDSLEEQNFGAGNQS